LHQDGDARKVFTPRQYLNVIKQAMNLKRLSTGRSPEKVKMSAQKITDLRRA
jgi:hypothetical protein